MNKWFGETWGARACDPAKHVPPPVGRECIGCKGPIVAEDRGHIQPVIGQPELDVVWHHECLMKNLGLRRFPPGYGANHLKPVVRVSHATLTLDDPEESGYRAKCPVCEAGVLRVNRNPETGRLSRHDYCSRCVQRFYYTDDRIAGEAVPP